MRALAAGLVCCTVIFGLAGAKHAQPVRVATFSQLPPGDNLKIDFKSQGCFGGEHWEFVFGRAPTPLISFTEHQDRWQGETRLGDEAVYRGIINLTGKDLENLDNLLAFYRGPLSHGCTTVNDIVIQQVHNGQLVATETIQDDSCQLDVIRSLHPEQYHYLSLPEVAYRFTKK